MYLVKGHDRAMLLDTGYGIGDLRAAVQNLTDGLEINVLLTHGHVDHVGGAAQFDHVYLNTTDEPVARKHGEVSFRLEFLKKTLPQQLAESGLERADLVSPKPLPYDSVSDGDRFDLGGVTVVAHAVPGHTPDMLVPVIVEDRVAVFGDACGENTLLCFPESLCVMEYAESLRKLREYEGEWDIVVRNHGTHQSPTSILVRNLDTAVATRNIERTRRLLSWGQGTVAHFDRLSVLSKRDFDTILSSFSPEELLFTDLLPQFSDAPASNLLRAGRNRSADHGMEATIACVSGFVVNMQDRSVRLVTPSVVDDGHPTGELVYETKAFTDGESLEREILGMIERHMHETISLSDVLGIKR